MVSSTATAFGSLVGWFFVPDRGTRFFLKLLTQLPPSLFPAGYTPPRPGSPRYATHYRVVFACGVLFYLLYTLIMAYTASAPNFYLDLGLPLVPEPDESALKAAFRTYARKHHPDRAGSQGEAQFIEIRNAYEALKNPVKRFAYDRFGAAALEWSHCTTAREYVIHGITTSIGFYIGSGGLMVLFATFGKEGHAPYWRYLLWSFLLAIELTLVLQPASGASLPPSSTPFVVRVLDGLFPNRTPHQHVLFLHQLFMALSMAITRIGPFISLDTTSKEAMQQGMEMTALKLAQLSEYADREVSRMLTAELRAMHGPKHTLPTTLVTSPTHNFSHFRNSSTFLPNSPSPRKRKSGQNKEVPVSQAQAQAQWNDEIVDSLTREMENMLIDTKIKSHPMLGNMWQDAVDRGRTAWDAQQQRQQQQEQQAALGVGRRRPSPSSGSPPPGSLPSPPATVTALPDASGVHGSPPPELEPSPPPDFSMLGMTVKRTPSYRSRSLSY